MGEETLYKCLNCGFIFREPEVKWAAKPFNPGQVLAIDPRALYYPKFVCPKCGSDAIKAIKEEGYNE